MSYITPLVSFAERQVISVKNQIEWIKMAVNLCMAEFASEQEKKGCFAELEEIYNQFTDIEQKSILDIIMREFEVNDAIYVFSVMVQYMEVKAFRKAVMECLIKGEFDGFIGGVLEYQAAVYVKGEYKQRRLFRKKNIGRLEEILAVHYPYIPLETRNKNHIVLVTGQVLKPLHAPSRIIMDLSYALQKYMGYEVILFICPCDRRLPEDLWNRPRCENSEGIFRRNPVGIQVRDIVVRGYQINMHELCEKEYNMMFDIIYAWNPFFVFDFSTINPIVDIIKNFTTLVSMPASIDCPVSEAQILIRVAREREELEKEYEDMLNDDQTQLFVQEKFPILVESNLTNCTRLELGLPEGQFLIAIVGNRLQSEIDEGFVCEMRKVLEKMPNIAFVIIGSEEGIKKYFEDMIFDGHIYYFGYRKDLLDVYGVLDLYLNPRRIGGGFSGGMALLAGIPVVTLPDCDVANNCGEEFIVQNYEDMISTVCRYASEPEFYNTKKECAKLYKEKNTDVQLERFVREMVDGVVNIMNEKGENYVGF